MESVVKQVLGNEIAKKVVDNGQARRWCFTVHLKNLLVEDMTLKAWEQWARTNDWVGVRYMVFQREKEGREHIQGYIHCTKVKRRAQINTLLKLKNTHLEMAIGSPSDNRAYCTEPEKRVGGAEYFEFGDCPGQQGSKLAAVAVTIKTHGLKRAIEESPQTYITNGRGMRDLDYFYKRQKCENLDRDVNVSVIIGTPGSGKSYWAHHFDRGNTYVMPDNTTTTWMDSYIGQRTLVIEDFTGKIPFRTLMRMLDNYPLDMQTKGGFAPCQYTEVIVTSNIHPNAWYDHSEDPWGLADVGPLQRRINTIVECKGVYPNALCNIGERTLPDGTPEWLPVQSLPTYAQMTAEPEPVVDQSADVAHSNPHSNAVPFAASASNECMPGFWPEGGIDTSFLGDNDDKGESEPTRSVNLFG